MRYHSVSDWREDDLDVPKSMNHCIAFMYESVQPIHRVMSDPTSQLTIHILFSPLIVK
jgi:hypothetical protein